MSTDSCREIETFYQFLGMRIQEGAVGLSPEESVEAFRAYQRDLERLRKELQPALTRHDQGESATRLDAEDVKRRGRERLALEGIND
jgi:hypothetical protein